MSFRDYLKEQLGDKGYRPLSTIAKEIRQTWPNVNYAAKPYLSAMFSLETMDDKCGMDDARSVVAYFLSNAATWRGPDAKRVKAELKAMLAGKPVPQAPTLTKSGESEKLAGMKKDIEKIHKERKPVKPYSWAEFRKDPPKEVAWAARKED